MRREIPFIITLVVGLVFLLAPLTAGNIPLVGQPFSFITATYFSPWTTIVAAFATGLASVNLLRIHANSISRKRAGWYNSVALVFALAFFFVYRTAVELLPANKALAAGYANYFNNILSPLSAAMFAVLAFYIASASYRAFRARSLEATVLLVAAVLVMIGAAPIGAEIWDQFPVIQRWLLAVPNMVGQRSIIIGAAIGGFATSLRILLGLERGHLGGE
ncbi:MAG: hypothetical protein FD169_682 [Bacillota bacterium]|nr:MAG: hypothetical protein FD169_682 [Bacillota bacterium]MBS3950864.1 hypothetical protein [Peptococcaceae bacterium]